ncbi:hypothetical protein CDA63_17010 [Hymenobacter amundsenii]|uniref:PAC domain-containing protein n=1 Tax=Hymenobacter amundsenii TaxID=2006685 RepID=A0A246FH88_9BACT|nr:PAS domain-containing protein [Hymenobacter amundsenii]OWP61889.1 hypothetical protein CDA63_17010 [Hymenobacter amundsenii]
MTVVAAPALPGDALPPDGMADVLFTTSPAGIMLLRPVYAADGITIVDLAWVRLNAAAQRMLRLPEQPTASFLTLFPAAPQVGVYQFYRDAFLSGHVERRQNLYQQDQLDGYYDLVAQRSGEVLVVHFTDGNDQPRTAVEEALRASQAREKAARAEAEAQHQRFYDLLMQLPAQVAVHEGPDQVFTLVNPGYRRLFPTRAFEGLPVREALPELAGPGGILDVLDGVYRTGEPFHGTEVELWVNFTATGQPEQVYLNAVFLPLRDAQGRIDGVLDFSVDVTAQVHARQQAQQLNQELETHVQQRTREAEAARAEAEEQRNRLVRLFSQAPAHINLFQGPDHVWTLVHPRTQELLPGRQLHGLPRRQAVPELPEEQHEPFDRVYRTGQPEHVVESSRRLDRFHTGELHEAFYDVTFQPKFDAAGHGRRDELCRRRHRPSARPPAGRSPAGRHAGGGPAAGAGARGHVPHSGRNPRRRSRVARSGAPLRIREYGLPATLSRAPAHW